MHIRLDALVKPLTEEAASEHQRSSRQRAHQAAAESVAVQDHDVFVPPHLVLGNPFCQPVLRLQTVGAPLCTQPPCSR